MARRRRRLAARARAYLRALLAFLFSNVGVVVLVVGYTIAGAFMFQAIENASEIERENNMTRERDNFTQHLWQNVTLALNLFNDTALKERLSGELAQYQARVVRAVKRGWDGGRSSRQWSFSSAFLYSLTVITTIGHGHLSPRTNWGKIVTILYALLGMPLFLLYLGTVGELLARGCKWLYALACLCRGCPGGSRRRRLPIEISEAESIERPAGWRRRSFSDTPELRAPPYYTHWDYSRRMDYPRGMPLPPRAPSLDSEFSYITFDAQTITVPISVCVAIMVGYLLFGSMIFGMWEQWDQLDGAYFCFISLSSIGFGDLVPGERVYSARIQTSFIVCSLYLMLGMALVAMCFNLMQEQVIHYFAGLKRALKRICKCKR